ncbi:hypothetical protein V6N12_058337 [Hibiscus sabdariffa]|uniref:Uncharacterized protein n=1 Tax=Hibiscus sabdariffa TaxID=183260 RepID=A0ABR2ETT9_9ROSI
MPSSITPPIVEEKKGVVARCQVSLSSLVRCMAHIGCPSISRINQLLSQLKKDRCQFFESKGMWPKGDQKTPFVFPPSSALAAFLNKPSSLLCATFLIEAVGLTSRAEFYGRERCNNNWAMRDLIKYCKRKEDLGQSRHMPNVNTPRSYGQNTCEALSIHRSPFLHLIGNLYSSHSSALLINFPVIDLSQQDLASTKFGMDWCCSSTPRTPEYRTMNEERHARKGKAYWLVIMRPQFLTGGDTKGLRPSIPWIDREGGQSFWFFHVVKELNNGFFVLSKS